MENNVNHRTNIPESLQNMNTIAKEILDIYRKFSKRKTLGQCLRLFYEIMRKHNIKKYDGNYRNPVWSMCYILFIDAFRFYWTIDDFLEDKHFPKDLLYYENKNGEY